LLKALENKPEPLWGLAQKIQKWMEKSFKGYSDADLNAPEELAWFRHPQTSLDLYAAVQTETPKRNEARKRIKSVVNINPKGEGNGKQTSKTSEGQDAVRSVQEEVAATEAAPSSQGAAPKGEAAPAEVVEEKTWEVQHQSSNLESVASGFTQRDLGISFARTPNEMLSSPTLNEGRGTAGVVHATVTGRGIDYTSKKVKNSSTAFTVTLPLHTTSMC
jgi:hypothetical protein